MPEKSGASRGKTNRQLRRRAAVLATVSIAAAPLGAFLQAPSPVSADIYWNTAVPTGGTWNTPGDWVGGVVPGSGDTARIESINAEVVTLNTTQAVYALAIGTNISSGTTTAFNVLNQTAGNLTSDDESVGGDSRGNGWHNQSGGSNTINSYLIPGQLAGTFGEYDVSNNAVLNLTGTGSNGIGLYVGDAGTGVFNQSGGTVAVGSTNASNLYLGYSSGAVGTVNLTGGVFNVSGNAYIGGNSGGAGGTGNFNVSASANTNVTGTLKIYGGGKVNFTGGTLSVGNLDTSSTTPAAFTNGWTGGTLNITGSQGLAINSAGPLGGTVTIPSALTLGVTNTLNLSGGTLNLNGGTVSAGTLVTSNPSQLNWTAGTLNITGAQGLAINSAGPLGGTVSIPSALSLGVANTLNLTGGTLNLNGGTVSAGTLVTSNPSQLSWTSGMLNITGAGGLTVDESAASFPGPALTLSANQYLDVTGGPLFVGNTSNGTINLSSNGSVTVGAVSNQNLYLGYTSGAIGSVTLNNTAATLNVRGNTFIGGNSVANTGTGALNILNGSFTATGATVVWNAGSLTVNGTAVFSSPTLTISGGTASFGSLAIGTGGNSQAVNVQSGSLAVSNMLSVGTGGTLSVTGTGTYSATTTTLSGTGTISAPIEYVGTTSAAGYFNQSGGTNTLNPPNDYTAAELRVGGSLARGVYTMNGSTAVLTSTVSAAYLYVGNGGTALFNQSAGTNSIPGVFIYGNAQNPPSYLLSGGTLSTQLNVGGAFFGQGQSGSFQLTGTGSLSCNSELVGDEGPGYFNQSGGTNTVSGPNTVPGILDVGGSGGIYTMNGSSAVLTGTGTINVGDGGLGTFNQSAGTVSIQVRIFGSTQTPPTYFLSGGTLSTALTVGGTGFYGGGDSGIFQLSGSGSLISDAEVIGEKGIGLFNQSGGTNYFSGSEGYLYVEGGGIYTMNGSAAVLTSYRGGTLSVMDSGAFNQSAGTVSNFSVEIYGSIQTPPTYFLSGGTLTTGLTVGGTSFYGSVYSGTFQLSGSGSLISGAEVIGDNGIGLFNQSGGTNNILGVEGYLYVESGGIYTMNGSAAVLSSGLGGTLTVGGSGIFNQSAGVTSVFTIDLEGASENAAHYLLSGTGSINSANEFSGADWNQSSGTNSVAYSLQIGGGQLIEEFLFDGEHFITNNFNGHYLMSGGTLIAGTVSVGVGYPGYDGYGVSVGALNVSGGTVMGGSMVLGDGQKDVGMFLLGGTATATVSGSITVNAGSQINMSGGILNAGSINLNGNSAAPNLAVGTLIATGSGNLSTQVLNINGGVALLPSFKLGGTNGNANALDLSAGSMNISNALTLNSGGLLAIQISGATQGSGYGFIQGSSGATAVLGGALAFSNTSGFTFAAGQSFQILNFPANSITGSFAAIGNLPGFGWDTSQLDTTGTLKLVAISSTVSSVYQNGGNGHWTTASNWTNTPATVAFPNNNGGTIYNAAINGTGASTTQVSLASSVSVNSLAMMSATLNVPAGVTLISNNINLGGLGSSPAPALMNVSSGNVLVSGLFTVNAGSTLAMSGTASISATTMNLSGATLNFSLGAPNAADFINVTGSGGLQLNGVTTVNISNAGGLAAGTYPLIDYVGSLTYQGLALGTTPSGFTYSLQDDTNNDLINLIVVGPTTYASVYDTAVGSGNWNVAGNWTNTPAITAYPNNNSSANYNVSINGASTNATQVTLPVAVNVNSLNVSSATLNIANGGSLTSGSLNLGIGGSAGGALSLVNGASLTVNGAVNVSGNAGITQSGGAFSVPSASAALDLSPAFSDQTTYNMSGGSLNAAGYLFVGDAGQAVFNQTDGAVTVGTGLYLGRSTSGNGTYLLSVGTLSTPYEFIGGYGPGLLMQTSGTNTVGTLVLGAPDNLGNYQMTGGTLVAQTVQVGTTGPGASSFNSSGTAVVNITSSFTNYGTTTLGGTQNWSSGATFTNMAGTAVFNSDAGTATASTLNVIISGGSVTFASTQHLTGLNVSTGTIAQITGGGTGHRSILYTPSLAVTGTLDLTGNDVDLQNGGAGGLAAITALVKQGYNNGTWTGAGITSSTAANDSTHLTAVGVVLNSGYIVTLDGLPVAADDVLAKYTYYGDANLDGMVDGSDYTRIDFAYLADQSNPTAMTGWYNGDFNYDGLIDGSDYSLIDNAFNTQGAVQAATIAGPSVEATDQIAGTASVPEPASLALLAIAATGALGQRRNRH